MENIQQYIIEINQKELIKKALNHNDTRGLEYLVKCGININQKFNDYNYPIIYAANNGLLDIVKLLISQNSECVNVTESLFNNVSQNYESQNALNWAITNGQYNVVKFLLEEHENENIYIAVRYDKSILMVLQSSLSTHEKTNMIRLLWDHGFDLNFEDIDNSIFENNPILKNFIKRLLQEK